MIIQKRDGVGSTANNGDNSDIKSALTSVPDYVESPIRKSKRNGEEHGLYPCQIEYSSVFLSKLNAKAPEVDQ